MTNGDLVTNIPQRNGNNYLNGTWGRKHGWQKIKYIDWI